MDDKTKLFVFSTKEIILILLFVLFGAVACFVLGVKVGKSFSYYQAGLTDADMKKVELLSTPEEKIGELTNTSESSSIESNNKGTMEKTYEKLQEEFDKLSNEKEVKGSAFEESLIEIEESDSLQNEKVQVESSGGTATTEPNDPHKGKYTVQLASYKKLEDAKMFAEGFQVRGYTPVITESDIPGKGKWFRVSLGIFDTVSQVKDYIKKEKSLFEGQSVVIRRFE